MVLALLVPALLEPNIYWAQPNLAADQLDQEPEDQSKSSADGTPVRKSKGFPQSLPN